MRLMRLASLVGASVRHCACHAVALALACVPPSPHPNVSGSRTQALVPPPTAPRVTASRLGERHQGSLRDRVESSHARRYQCQSLGGAMRVCMRCVCASLPSASGRAPPARHVFAIGSLTSAVCGVSRARGRAASGSAAQRDFEKHVWIDSSNRRTQRASESRPFHAIAVHQSLRAQRVSKNLSKSAENPADRAPRPPTESPDPGKLECVCLVRTICMRADARSSCKCLT